MAEFGDIGMPYSVVLIMFQTILWNMLDRVAGYWKDGCSLQHMCAYILYKTTMYFVLFPSAVLLADFIVTRKLNAGGWARAALYAGVFMLCEPFIIVVPKQLWALKELAQSSMIALAILLVVECISLACVLALYRPCRRARPV